MMAARHSYLDILRDIGEFYDNVCIKYELLFPNLSAHNKSLASSILTTLNLRNGARVADFGCGYGGLLRQLAQLRIDLNLLGVDASRRCIEYASLCSRQEGKAISFYVTDWLSARAIVGDKLDLLLCVGNSLTHYPPLIQKQILGAFADLLNAGGYLLVDTYKGWNDNFTGRYVFEPKGLVLRDNTRIVSCFFSHYRKLIAVRTVCISYYDAGKEHLSQPKSSEYYTTYQYPFVVGLSSDWKEYGFASINMVPLVGGTGNLDYFLLQK